MTDNTPILRTESLSLSIGDADILRDINLSIFPGEILGLAGPSGAGKSMLALAIMGLTSKPAKATGVVALHGQNLISLHQRQLATIRGKKIAMVFQEPMTALNPLMTIGAQIDEVLRIHTNHDDAEIERRTHTTLKASGLDPDDISPKRYPHELSGGQRQRAVIAMALAASPDLVIADEPTTALDAATANLVLDCLTERCAEENAALLLITHDRSVLRARADRVLVMRQDGLLDEEEAQTYLSFAGQPSSTSRHPERADDAPIFTAEHIRAAYASKTKNTGAMADRTFAVDDVSFSMHRGEIMGLVGESGCGKSTLARSLLGLGPMVGGHVRIGDNIFSAGVPKIPADYRRSIQIVFQDPADSFNPRMRIGRIIEEPMHLVSPYPDQTARRRKAAAALKAVGLDEDAMDRFPHAFSGGQRQRIAIARALIIDPKVVIMDEPVSALDDDNQHRIINLVRKLADEKDTAFLFITHDLNLVRSLADRILIMKDGRIVEYGENSDIFEAPSHPYTKHLLEAGGWVRAVNVSEEPARL